MTNFWRTLILLALIAGIITMAIGSQPARIVGGIVVLVCLVTVQTIIQFEEDEHRNIQ